MGVSKRKKKMQESAKKAGAIKIEKSIIKKSALSLSSNEKEKRNLKVIDAASNKKTKSTSNPFSRLMKLYKCNQKLKKSVECERLRRARDAKKRKNELKVEREIILQQPEDTVVTYANEDSEDVEIMDIEKPAAFVTTEPPVAPNIRVLSRIPDSTSKDDEENVTNFVPKKNTKFIKKRSVFYRIRKLRQLAEEMTGGAAYVNTPNQRIPMSLDKQAELLFLRKLKARQVDHLSKLIGKCFSYKTLMKKLKPILQKFPITRTKDDKLTVSLIESLKERLKNVIHKLPKNKRIRLTIVADKGESITKICYYFNDVQKPQATENLGILCFYIGDDDSESIKGICEALNIEIEQLLDDGLIIDGTKYNFEFFISGDCKSLCSMIDVQGCNAMKFCHHCLTNDYSSLGECRTVEQIIMDAKAIMEEIESLKLSKKKLSGNKIRMIKQKFNSVSHGPFFKRIDHTHIVPHALHLLMALVNILIEYFKHSRLFHIFIFCHYSNYVCFILAKIIKDLKVEPIQGRTEYNGNSCRKILNYFRGHTPASICELQMFHLFKQAANVLNFAVARILSPDEIEKCESAIQRLFDDLDGLSKFKYNNKLHILRFHVISFVRLNGSWGLFSEQSIERLHRLVNDCRKRISSHNDFRNSIYAMKMLIIGTYFYDLK